MKRAGVVLVSAMVVSVSVLAATASARTAQTAKLHIVATSPFTVAGSGFRLRERIRVTATVGRATKTVRVRATRLGTFRLLLGGLGVTSSHCDLIRVVATGVAGSTAVLKRLPPPACLLQRSNG